MIQSIFKYAYEHIVQPIMPFAIGFIVFFAIIYVIGGFIAAETWIGKIAVVIIGAIAVIVLITLVRILLTGFSALAIFVLFLLFCMLCIFAMDR